MSARKFLQASPLSYVHLDKMGERISSIMQILCIRRNNQNLLIWAANVRDIKLKMIFGHAT